MKTTKKLLAILMTIAVLFSMAIPVQAAETYSITINHPIAETNHTYEAYQLFVGELSTNALGKEVLSNVKWGTGVDGDALITAITTGTTYPNCVALFKDAKTADEVAEILGDNSNNATFVTEFAKAAGTCLTDVCVASTLTDDNGTYVISGLESGYYLVKDKDGSLEDVNETYTNYILQVVGNTELNPKNGTTTVDKVIHDGGSHVEAADFSIGDTIAFELIGTLPENYSRFESFEYEFIDTMSKGLTFTDGSLEVSLENAGTKVKLESGYTVETSVNAETGETNLNVKFADLKAITDRTIDTHTKIIVEYKAVLNENAVIGGAGNPNTVYIEYDNNPHTDGKGKTKEDTVYAFTFELDVTKYDGDTGAVLANAKFIIYRELLGAKHYAVLNAENEISSWSTNVDDATILTSGDDGKFIIKGLESDIYFLEETEAPIGYDLLADRITVDIRASVSEGTTGGQVDYLQINVNNGTVENGDVTTGIVNMSVINNPGSTLPETGGIGTTLFYIAGGLIVAVVVVMFITKKRVGNDK